MIIWTFIYILSTLPSFKVAIDNLNSNSKNASSSLIDYGHFLFKLANITDLVSYSFFTIDITLRFLVSPKKKKFFLNIINLIDVASILLFFIFFILISIYNDQSIKKLILFIRCPRIILLLKYCTFSWKLDTIRLTLKKSFQELLLLAFCICLSLIITSTILFNLESYEASTSFDSIPVTFWYFLF